MLREKYKLIPDSAKVVVYEDSDGRRARTPSQAYRLIGRLRLRVYPVLTYCFHRRYNIQQEYSDRKRKSDLRRQSITSRK
jgi:hypothetical protein